KAVTDRKKCTACGKCTDYCNLNLREVAGKEYPVDQLVKELRKDEMFYEESGGGVTLSGGEVMLADIDYLEELVKKLHHFGISVTVDTCGQAPYENYERILPYVDTFLYDIKLMDSEIHKKYMGTGNELILSNLEKLSRDGARLYIRIPTVKEVNGSDEAMKAIINYLLEKNIHVTRVNLLPYHNTGSGKYMKIGKNYEGADLHAPDKEEMNHFVELFREAGFHNIKIGG
ncbi:MAG TPA: glycyl-radical enzyme activating protein, partial [Lachnospiraceae bacterium]|nr:glycyl-radical enzyme activating protein [Lachnospiraceae bacterium]